ncbi:MAG: folylpolyglutamate synthase/dihydrofolate synthase family protein [Fuerstiella sp.]
MSTPEIHSYSEAMKWISDRIDYEKIRPRKSSRHFRRERMAALLKIIGSPQDRIPVVHIAGTKGKGTTAAILHSILVSSNIKTGLFTSPHLHKFEERMRVNHDLPSEELVTELVQTLINALHNQSDPIVEDGPTYFEIATLLAWMLFDRQKVDVVILETGLGGRLDCTNTCQPVLTMITSIGFDHTDILGDTLEEIAAEKAGIIKPGIPNLTAADQPEVLNVIDSVAHENGGRSIKLQQAYEFRIDQQRDGRCQVFSFRAAGFEFDSLRLPLLGAHQVTNAGLAIAAAELLSKQFAGINAESIRQGIETVSWPIRFEIIADHPTVILDAAHNPDSVEAFVRTYQSCFVDQNSIVLFGGSQDKDIPKMLGHLVSHMPTRLFILSQYTSGHRACDPQELLRFIKPLLQPGQQAMVAATPQAALDMAIRCAHPVDTLSVLGSIFFSAEIRELISR